MSLKARLILLVAGALLVSFLVGGSLIVVLAAGWLRSDIEAEAEVARHLVEDRAQEIVQETESTDRVTDLLRSLETRHNLRADFVPAGAREPAMPTGGPDAGLWTRILGFQATERVIPLGSDGKLLGHVILVTEPAGAVAKLWEAVRIGLAVAAAFAMSTLALVTAGLARSLEPLRRLAGALSQVGSGDYSPRIGADGPREIALIGRQFDSMAEQLQDMQARTKALTAQLIAVRERERRDIARDLHDDLGPCLLAANVDVSTLVRLNQSDRRDLVAECADALGRLLDRMQTLVRGMIERMHFEPSELASLDTAIDDLTAFWRERRPDIIWRRSETAAWSRLPPGAIVPFFRVVQEAVSNAVRHSGAGAISIDCTIEGGDVVLRIADDGCGIPDGAAPGFGLAGMRARLEAIGAAFAVHNDPGRGVTIEARVRTAERVTTFSTETAGAHA